MKNLNMTDEQLKRVAKFIEGKKEATQDNDAWDRYEMCLEALGPEQLLEEIVRSMSTEEAIETFDFIARMHDLGSMEEEEDW